MKKVIALLLAVLLILSMAACSSTESSESSSRRSRRSRKNSATSYSTDPLDPIDDSTPVDDDQQGQDDQNENSDTEQGGEVTYQPVTAGEVVLIDNDEVTFKVTDINPNGRWGYTLKVFMENKSADTDYSFYLEDSAVNGLRWDTYLSEDVAAGKMLNEEIVFYDDDLARLVSDFTDITLVLRVREADNWSADPIVKDTFHIYPLGEENKTTYVRARQPGDIVLVDNDECTVTLIGCEKGEPDDYYAFTMNLYVENKTSGSELWLESDDVSVNGYMCDPYYIEEVLPGMAAYSEITWTSSDFDKNGITDVNEIEMLFSVYRFVGGYNRTYNFNEVVTINP